MQPQPFYVMNLEAAGFHDLNTVADMIEFRARKDIFENDLLARADLAESS